MKFSEAMLALEEGKKVRLIFWQPHLFICRKENLIKTEANSIAKTLAYNAFDGDWELYQEPEKTYSFMEILPLLKEGKKVRRKCWVSWVLCAKEGYFYSCEAGKFFSSIFLKIEDLEANDWILVDEE